MTNGAPTSPIQSHQKSGQRVSSSHRFPDDLFGDLPCWVITLKTASTQYGILDNHDIDVSRRASKDDFEHRTAGL